MAGQLTHPRTERTPWRTSNAVHGFGPFSLQAKGLIECTMHYKYSIYKIIHFVTSRGTCSLISYSLSQSECPSEANQTWIYPNNGQWFYAGNGLSLDCLPEEGTLHIKIFYQIQIYCIITYYLSFQHVPAAF